MDEKSEEKEINVEAEALKEEEVKEVSTADKDIEYQEKLEKGFELDMEDLGDHLNLVQSSIQTIVSAISTGGSLSERDYPLLITNLETTLSFLENMQDYSELEKYKNSYSYLEEGSQYLSKAYTTFNSFFESQNQDVDTFIDIFFKGLETYNQALKKFELLGETYKQEYIGNSVDANISDKISITKSEKDGIHYWKGEKEIVDGEDWNMLNEDEKIQLIMLDIEQTEASGIVETKKLSAEYVELLNNYFNEQTNQKDSIKDVITEDLIDEIKNK
ncbi:hypothetical protein [Lysinibacillus varians]|uniref:LXG domain-containing protein n=1 Tax=Lysinibacillus varians TaxID=1145276 RepID=A0ABY2T7V6_9BACI|nr:hypothetical protein [Lysinibacillus varians]AHN24426.1 hypothetical protein T479_17055 [Lysinibacillus varians]TKI60254.1 hypothetical protein FC752_15935 [Lysinibacillus varians]